VFGLVRATHSADRTRHLFTIKKILQASLSDICSKKYITTQHKHLPAQSCNGVLRMRRSAESTAVACVILTICIGHTRACDAGSSGQPGACTECVAGKYKYESGHAACTDCPASRTSHQGATSAMQCFCTVQAPLAVSPTLASLRGHVSNEILDTWASYGVQEWVSGGVGLDCQQTCMDKNLTCSESLDFTVFRLFHYHQMRSIKPIVTDGSQCVNVLGVSDAKAPYTQYTNCFHPVIYAVDTVFTCAANQSDAKRICPCVTDPQRAALDCHEYCPVGFYGAGGMAPCTACPPDRTSQPGATECVCPVGVPLALTGEPLDTLRGHVRDNILDAWAAYGVQEWVQGRIGQDCTETCSAQSLVCRNAWPLDVFHLFQFTQMQAIRPIIADGTLCGGTISSPSNAETPYSAHGACYFPDINEITKVFTCAANASIAERICPCARDPLQPEATCQILCAPGSWSEDGFQPCSNCPTNRTSPAGAKDVTECVCVHGTYLEEDTSAPASVPFPTLRGHGLDDTLDTWAAHGFHAWVLGALGDDCSATCINEDMTCNTALDNTIIAQVQPSEMQTIIPLITAPVVSCGTTLAFPGDQKTPYMTYGMCLHPYTPATVGTFSCTAQTDVSQRMCPCTQGGMAAALVQSLQCVLCPTRQAPGNVTPTGCPLPDHCPENTTKNGSHVFCACSTGFGHSSSADNISCAQCVAGKYKDNVGNTPCSDCAAGFYSGVLAASTSNVCVACAKNTYSNKTGATTANVCKSCPQNSSSFQGSSALSHCVCDAPFVKHADETCVCPVDTFYENDPATCTDCQANAQAPMGSNSLLNCICNAGYQGQNGQMCAECHMGKYKSFAGMSP